MNALKQIYTGSGIQQLAWIVASYKSKSLILSTLSLHFCAKFI